MAETDVLEWLTENRNHRVYIVTYSQLDEKIFPTRQSFARACVAAFGGQNVLYFACCREEHATEGSHYHVCMRLRQGLKWFSAKKYLLDNYNVVVHFSESPNGGMYAGAYRYVTKEDGEVYIGHCLQRHPREDEIGKNKAAHKANTVYRQQAGKAREARATGQSCAGATGVSTAKGRKRRVDKLEIVEFIRSKKIRNQDELLAAAEIQRVKGESDLPRAVINLGKKGRAELISDAWQMESAIGNVVLQRKTRIEIVREIGADSSNCVCQQRGMWLCLALEVLMLNGIESDTFARAVFINLLREGRHKDRNIMLVGERNCAKTFLLEPLQAIFKKTFSSPASSQFGWLGVEEAQIIYLNDFRWVPLHLKGGNIAWAAMLRLLEGGEAKLPAPMNSCSEHIVLTKENDVPVFCTSRGPLVFYNQFEAETQTPRHAQENRMMSTRWKTFELTHVFEEEDKIECPECAYIASVGSFYPVNRHR